MNTIPTKTQVTVVIPCFGSAGTKAFLNFLAHQDKPLSEKRNGAKLTLVYEANTMTNQFRHSLATIFNEDYLSWEANEVPMFASKTEWLLDLIRNFDWTYQMSDDHRYWVAGQNATELVTSLIKELRHEIVKDVNWTALRMRIAATIALANGGEWAEWIEELIK